VAVKIRLKRMGKVRAPHYRIVVVDSRKKRDGRVLEEIGHYHPKEEPSFIDVVSDRAQYWLGVGAQPSEAVAKLLKITGDWQTFKGLKGTDGSQRFAEPKPSKQDIFNEALKDSANEPKAGATTSRKKSAAKAEPPADEAPVAPPLEAPVAEAAAEETPAENPAAATPAEAAAEETPAEESPVTTEAAADADVAEAEGDAAEKTEG
jgi:small subunit ribosomal protein S16